MYVPIFNLDVFALHTLGVKCCFHSLNDHVNNFQHTYNLIKMLYHKYINYDCNEKVYCSLLIIMIFLADKNIEIMNEIKRKLSTLFESSSRSIQITYNKYIQYIQISQITNEKRRKQLFLYFSSRFIHVLFKQKKIIMLAESLFSQKYIKMSNKTNPMKTDCWK